MTTFVDIVASVVVHSSAVALSHFGVTVEAPPPERAPTQAERVVARTPAAPQHRVLKLTNSPAPLRRTHVKAI